MLPFIVPTSVAPITLGSTLLPFGQTTTSITGLTLVGAVASGGFTTSGQQMLSGGTDAAPAAIFPGPPGPTTSSSKYAFSFVPAETAASSFNLTAASYTNAGDTRMNQVFRFGANIGVTNIQNFSDAGIFDTWESHYAPDSARYVERHISFVPAGGASETRLWSAMVNKATGASVVSQTVDRWLLYRRTDASVFFDLSTTSESFLTTSLNVGLGNASATGNTFSVYAPASATSVYIRAGATQSGTNIFTVAKADNTYAFKIDSAYDVYSVGGINALSLVATADSFSSSWITTGSMISLRNNGSLNLRNSASSAGIFFSSGTHEYDARDVSIVRGQAGQIAITDGSDGAGSSGTYRDIKLRSLTTNDTAFLHNTSAALADGAGAQAATITNGPVVGNPTKWVAINDNGTTRYLPLW